MVWWSNPALLTQILHHLSDKHKNTSSGREVSKHEPNPLKWKRACCVVGGVMLIWLALHPFWMPSVTRQLEIRHPVVLCVYVGGSLAMAKSMAMAAKVPARPWPLMKMVLYFWGRRPTRPNRLPCNMAPNAGENKCHFIQHFFTQIYTHVHYSQLHFLSGLHSHRVTLTYSWWTRL